jgi:anthranilate/para-aminobenzoate synthase component I
MAIATSTSVTPADVLDYLLTLTPTEETLVYGSGRGQVRRLTFPLDYTQAWLAPLSLYQCLNASRPGVLYESVDIAPTYGRYSLAVIDPPVIVEGKDETFRIRALNRRGQAMLAQTLSATDIPCCPHVQRSAQELGGIVPCERRPVAEDERLHLNNISQVIRNLLHAFRCDDRFLGLWGAFAYDFVRLF